MTKALKVSLKLKGSSADGSDLKRSSSSLDDDAVATPATPGTPPALPVPPKKSRKSAPKKKDLYTVLEKLHATLQSRDTYGFFMKPVDVALVPDYLDVIKQPMDLSTMKRKLTKREYTTIREFQVRCGIHSE